MKADAYDWSICVLSCRTAVLKDGADRWWDVSNNPADLTSYTEIKDWGAVLETRRSEYKDLLKVLPQYDLYFDEYNEPGVTVLPKKTKRYSRKHK